MTLRVRYTQAVLTDQARQKLHKLAYSVIIHTDHYPNLTAEIA